MIKLHESIETGPGSNSHLLADTLPTALRGPVKNSLNNLVLNISLLAGTFADQQITFANNLDPDQDRQSPGGGGTLNLSSYVGLDPASTALPKNIRHTQNNN